MAPVGLGWVAAGGGGITIGAPCLGAEMGVRGYIYPGLGLFPLQNA